MALHLATDGEDAPDTVRIHFLSDMHGLPVSDTNKQTETVQTGGPSHCDGKDAPNTVKVEFLSDRHAVGDITKPRSYRRMNHQTEISALSHSRCLRLCGRLRRKAGVAV